MTGYPYDDIGFNEEFGAYAFEICEDKLLFLLCLFLASSYDMILGQRKNISILKI